MPIGLMFQSAAIALWSWALVSDGRRVVGLSGIAVGTLLVAALDVELHGDEPAPADGARSRRRRCGPLWLGVLLMRRSGVS